MESLIYTYFESGSLVIVPRVTKNNAWLDTETDPMIWRSIERLNVIESQK